MRALALALLALAAPVLAQPKGQVTSPAPGTQYLAPASISITAQASVPANRIEFLANGDLIGTAVAAPYAVVWSNAPLGTHLLSVRIVEADGQVSLSPAVPIQVTERTSPRVDTAPSVQLTSPGSGTVLIAPASVTLTATAADSDGTVTKVDFFQGTTPVGSSTTAPYTVTLGDLPGGSYSFSASATDDQGAVTTSAPATVIINVRPTVALASPANDATFNAPADIALAAEASDTDGSIASVDFFFGDTLITTRTAPPYGFTWTGVPAGTYLLTARVTDDLGASVTSAAVAITVKQAVAQLYFIHVDHLDTPRLIADAQQRTVWRWDQQEPFGVNVPDENPSGLGASEFPLRFPGQYFDRETNLHYNSFRDYDPSLGRYKQSDLLGIAAGLNTYAYAGTNPLIHVDPLGLAYFAYRGIQGVPFGFMLVTAALSAYNVNIAHEHLFFEDGLSPPNLGFGQDGLFTEPVPIGYARTVGGFDDCIMRMAVLMTPVSPMYNVVCQNCQDWAANVRAQYAILARDPVVQQQCRCKETQPTTKSATSTNKDTTAAAAAAAAAATLAALLLFAF